jgi:hypothetical protein
MQDNAIAHTANNSMVAVQKAFDERIKSQGFWPPLSPDLNPCDFYLWSTLKEKVYVNNLQSLKQLQENIRHEISLNPVQQVQRVYKHILMI